MKSQRSALAGIGFAVAAVACFAVLDTTTKFVSASVPLLMALWFRYFFQAASSALVLLPMHGRLLLRTEHPRFQVARGLLLLTSSLFAFYSLSVMPVGEFTAIIMVTPLVVTVLAATWLKERVSLLRWLFVIGGFVGTVIIIRPGGHAFGWASLLPLGLVASSSCFQVLTSRLARTERPETMHLYTGWVGALTASLFLPFVWTQIDDWRLWALMVLMGSMGTIGHFLLILAFRNAEATTITPYLYLQIAFAMLGGWLVFAHVPDGWAVFGIALISVCGACGAWLTAREAKAALAVPGA